jgi:hypothetical protein
MLVLDARANGTCQPCRHNSPWSRKYASLMSVIGLEDATIKTRLGSQKEIRESTCFDKSHTCTYLDSV